jgi:hypothetical protein
MSSVSTLGSARIELGSVSGKPGTTVRIPIKLTADSPVVAGEFEVVTESPYLLFQPLETGPASSRHRLLSTSPTSGRSKTVVYSVVNEPLQDGVVAWIPVRLLANSPDTAVAVAITNITLLSASTAVANPVFSIPAVVHVSGVGFDRIGRQSDGSIEIELSAREDRAYIIQVALSLDQVWSNISTNFATNGVIRIQDNDAITEARFYRVLLQP